LGVASLSGHYVAPAFAAAVRPPEERASAALDGARAEFQQLAYGLSVSMTELNPLVQPDTRALATHAPRLSSAPIWDGFAIASFLNTRARIQSYYQFENAALAGYQSPTGRLVPVYLSARELDLSSIHSGEHRPTWESVHRGEHAWAHGLVAVSGDRVN